MVRDSLDILGMTPGVSRPLHVSLNDLFWKGRYRVLGYFRSQQPGQLSVPNLIFHHMRLGQQPLKVRDIFTVDEAVY